MVSHYHSHIALAVIAENIKIIQETEVQIYPFKTIQNHTTRIAILSRQVEMVQHIQDQISRIIHKIQDHTLLTITETEIVHDDRPHVIGYAMFGIK